MASHLLCGWAATFVFLLRSVERKGYLLLATKKVPMSAGVILPRTQIAILVVLLVLTAATVAVSFLNIPGRWHFSAGLAIAVLKATLVILFFMHVIHSPAATRAVIVVSVFWLTAVLIGLMMTDYLTRGSVEFAPGH